MEPPLFAVVEPYTLVRFYFTPGTYILKTAQGNEWLGEAGAFGPGGEYRTTEPYEFKAGYSYEITTGTRGDFYDETAGGFME